MFISYFEIQYLTNITSCLQAMKVDGHCITIFANIEINSEVVNIVAITLDTIGSIISAVSA